MNPLAIIVICLIVLGSNITGWFANADGENTSSAGIIGSATIWVASIITILESFFKICHYYYLTAP